MMPMPPPMIGMPMPADDKLKQAQRAKAPGGKDDKVTTVFVGGLRKSTTEDKVIGHFSKFGQVDNVDIKRLPDGTSRGFAFVKFVDRESVDKVIEAKSSHMIDNKWVAVRPHGGSAFAAAQNAERSKQAEEIRKKEKHEDDLQQEDYEEKWSERYLQQAASMQKDEGDGTGEAKEGGDSMMNPMMAMMGMMNPMMMGMMNPMMMRPPMMMGCGCPGAGSKQRAWSGGERERERAPLRRHDGLRHGAWRVSPWLSAPGSQSSTCQVCPAHLAPPACREPPRRLEPARAARRW
ncbi:sqd [Symbiodinium sp. CCMP2592]|nr:sqd [Symbiodinium sp. CCMP2592]